jgi:LacI family transcriptional regulator
MTIKELAKIAGVSPKTVSRVINNEEHVTSETREKVLKTIKETNYKPNIYAQSLRKKVQKNILVSILKNKNSPIPQWIEIMINELVERGNKMGYTLLMETYSNAEDIKKISMLNFSMGFLDGAILFYEKKNDPRIILLKESNVPYIIFDKAYDEESPYVTNDDYSAMLEGTEYLLGRGCDTVELLLGNESPTNLEREKGAIKAYENKNTELKKLKIKYGITHVNDAYEYTKKRIKSKNLPKAFFVSGDEKVLGVYKALQEKNINVPEDISVMGFDNIPISEFYHPSLTTIEQDYYKMSEAIFDYFGDIQTIENKAEIKVKTKLIIRKSTK